MRRVLLAGSALWLVVLLTAGGASAAPTWLPPHDLSPDGWNSEAPQIAVDSAGDVAAVWYRWNGSGSVIEAVEHPAGGDWRFYDLSAENGAAYYPRVAVSPAGDAVAVWYGSNGANDVIQASRGSARGFWGPSQDLSAPGEQARFPDVALDEPGNSVAIWQRFDGANWIVQAVFGTNGYPLWAAPEDLSAAGQDAEDAHVALDRVAGAVAVWRRFNGTNWIVQAATHQPGFGSWSTQDLSAPGQDADSPQVGFDRYGNALAVWTRFDGANWVVQASFRPRDGAWSAAQNLSLPLSDAREPEVAFNPSFGNAMAIWTRNDDTVQVAEHPQGGDQWTLPQDVATPGTLTDDVHVGLDSGGNAIAVWRLSDGGANGIVQTRRRPAGGRWGFLQTLSPPGQAAFNPEVAVDPAGNALATWSRFSSGADEIVQADALDGAGPVFTDLSVPARGSPGTRIAFSVSSFDVWTGPAELPHWRFGDGRVADGYAVHHIYATNGSYTVTVSQTDAVGNRSSVSRTVSVRPVRCVVPNVVGKILARAKATLRRRSCRAGKVTRIFWSAATTGRVIAQHPKAGARLPRGSRVDLLVSRGRRL